MVVRKYWWVKFSDEDFAKYIYKETQKMAIDLNMELEVFRGKMYEALVKDPEIRTKIIEYIKKNGSRTN